jgi:hypothetical protein
MNIFVLFDALTPYKEILYDAIVEGLGEDVNVNIFSITIISKFLKTNSQQLRSLQFLCSNATLQSGCF